MSDQRLNIWSGLPGGDQVEAPSAGAGVLEIWGFAEHVSYRAGESVRLFVHTTAAAYSLEVVRDGLESVVVYRQDQVAGRQQRTRPDAAVTGCDWTDPFIIETSAAWGAGAFMIRLSTSGKEGQPATGEAFFALRPPVGQEAPIAFILTTSTWQAYNDWGGGNHYRSVSEGVSTDTPLPELSRRRPWARGQLVLPDDALRHADVPDLPPGGTPDYPWLGWALANGYTRHYCDAGWAYYERPFAHWMEAAGYRFDVLTQDDLHLRPGCLDTYGVAVIVGHDEYWSWEMRDTIDAFTEGGGRLARFGGNMLWQIRLEQDYTRQVCYKLSAIDPITAEAPRRASTHWDSRPVNRPATQSFGLTGLMGVYHRFGMCMPRSPGGYTVYRPDHWALADTDLYYGDVFGAGASRILAFEVDGVDYTFRNGLPYPTGLDGAPEALEIIGLAPAGAGELNRRGGMINAPVHEVFSLLEVEPTAYPRPLEAFHRGAAVMASFRRGQGEVFNAGCCEWVTGLIRHDETVDRITRNVLNRFLSGSSR